jgi:hypothetical protein
MSVLDSVRSFVYDSTVGASNSVRRQRLRTLTDVAIIVAVLLVGAGRFDVALVVAIVSIALSIRAGNISDSEEVDHGL